MKTPVALSFGCIALLLLCAVENVAGQACSSSPCQNGGTCFELSMGGFVCTCNSNFNGSTCETALNGVPVTCSFNTCANGGDCLMTNDGIKCKCTADYTGPKCETLVDIIASTELTSTPLNTKQTATTSKTIRQTTSSSISNPELTSTPLNIKQTATTSRTIRQTTSSSISNPGSSPVDLWIIIAIAVAAAIVVILVVILIICVILKGKSSSGKSRTTSTPHMISDFTNHADRDNHTTNPTYTGVQHNAGYDEEELDDDYPPPSYNESNMTEGYTFTDSNQLSHENDLDYDKNSDGDSLDTLNADYKFDMY